MGRWEPNARGRLEQAALELYLARGFDRTTVADIAERAGLAERTFFRHFADKREVLFAGSTTFQALLVDAVAAAPAGTPPLDAVATAIEAAGAELQQRAEHARRRQAVIAAEPVLQERELIKLASIATDLAAALRARGVTEPAATLAAETGVAVLRVAVDLWATGDKDADLPTVMRESFRALRDIATT